MAHYLDKLCFEMISNIQKESDIITSQIDVFYKENKNKKDVKNLAENKFQEQIEDFNSKYAYTWAGLINKATKEVVEINVECSEQLKDVVNKLKNYISELD